MKPDKGCSGAGRRRGLASLGNVNSRPRYRQRSSNQGTYDDAQALHGFHDMSDDGDLSIERIAKTANEDVRNAFAEKIGRAFYDYLEMVEANTNISERAYLNTRQR